jgi:hypothetical protein
VPGRRRAVAPVQQPEPVADPGCQLGRCHRPQPGRREFDRQRQAVQLAAHPFHLRGDREPRPHRRSPVGEQRHLRGTVQCGHRVQHLAGEPQRLSAGRQDPHPGRARQQRGDQHRGRVDQVLAVVQHQQHPAVAEHLHQAVDGVRESGHHPDAGPSQQREHGRRDPVRIRHGPQFHHPRLGVEPGRHLDREPRLAHSAGAGQRHQPVVPQAVQHRGQIGVPADERGPAHGHVAPPGRRVGPQRQQVRVPQLLAGVGAQLVGQRAPHALVHP